MRILIDLRCLETASAGRGVGRYTREIVAALRPILPDGWRLAGLSWSDVAAALGIEWVPYRGPRLGIGFADRVLLPPLLRREGVRLHHSPVYALPTAGPPGVALVLTVHDLAADVHPEGLSLRHRAAFRRTFRSAAAADRVIAVSETTRRDLLGRYAVDPGRVVVVPNGVSPALAVASEEGAASRWPRPFVLYVGGLDRLKNVDFLLGVVARCRREGLGLHLVAAGEEGPRRERLLGAAGALGLADAVVAPGRLTDADLAAAYRGAAAFVFPSRYEGFGLPPLEAMAAGCPVVSSPAGALREVLGGAALLVGPDDEPGWAGAIAALLRDAGLRRERIAAGRERAAAHTWEASARRTLDAYRAAIGGGGAR